MSFTPVTSLKSTTPFLIIAKSLFIEMLEPVKAATEPKFIISLSLEAKLKP